MVLSTRRGCKAPSRLKLDTITAIQAKSVKSLHTYVLGVHFPWLLKAEVLLRDPHTYIDIAAVLPMILRIEASFVVPLMSERPFSHYVLVSWPKFM